MILFSYATGGMSGDIFQLYVTRTLGYSPSLVTIVALSMIISIPIQFLAPRIIEAIGHRTMMITGTLMFLPSLLLMYSGGELVALSRTAGACCFVVGATLAEIAISVSYGAAWSAWVVDFTTSANRPYYISLAGFVSQGTVAAAFLIQTTLFDGEVTETYYRIVLLYCLIYALASIAVFRRLPDPLEHRTTGGIERRVRWREILAERNNRVILISQIGQFLIGVPLLSIYATSVLGVPAAALGIVLILRTVAALAGMPIAGRLITRFGATRALVAFGSILVAEMILWTVLPEFGGSATAITLFTTLVLGFQLSKCIFAVATSSVEFDVIKPEHRVRAFTLIDIVSSSAMQLNIAIGGLAVSMSRGGALLDSSFIRLDAVKILTALGAIVALYIAIEYHRMSASVVGSSKQPESVVEHG
ncbi:MFS transporter [Nocardia brasiliensis]|uniref:MFS transporter n=1 Tax=Nocardia brasiliensis TaxID=37326 RepID=UPI001893D912|nr:MFS transporter [Nocardia brasiliensis]MBF6546637.1 MFS transporter [Nocardia brasiliensis]